VGPLRPSCQLRRHPFGGPSGPLNQIGLEPLYDRPKPCHHIAVEPTHVAERGLGPLWNQTREHARHCHHWTAARCATSALRLPSAMVASRAVRDLPATSCHTDRSPAADTILSDETLLQLSWTPLCDQAILIDAHGSGGCVRGRYSRHWEVCSALLRQPARAHHSMDWSGQAAQDPISAVQRSNGTLRTAPSAAFVCECAH